MVTVAIEIGTFFSTVLYNTIWFLSFILKLIFCKFYFTYFKYTFVYVWLNYHSKNVILNCEKLFSKCPNSVLIMLNVYFNNEKIYFAVMVIT